MIPPVKEAYIVYDGDYYFGIYANEYTDDLKIVEKHLYWSDEMDRHIDNLNNGQ